MSVRMTRPFYVLCDRLIAIKLYVTTRIVGAVARHVDSATFGLERCSGKLGAAKLMPPPMEVLS
jgi:hypothetical protein